MAPENTSDYCNSLEHENKTSVKGYEKLFKGGLNCYKQGCKEL